MKLKFTSLAFITLNIIISLSAVQISSAKSVVRETSAADNRISYTGRVLAENGNVSFDWSGVYCRIRFTGPSLTLRCSDTRANYFNVWIDSEFSEKSDKIIRTAGEDTAIVIAEKLGRGIHEVLLQKRTEGEQGTVTFHSFITEGEILPASESRQRYIEFIGDSYTCGYGTENSIATDPFTPETENCNLTYAAIAARYFDADFALICHSGQGIERNYDGFGKGHTMVDRYSQMFDENKEIPWTKENIKRIPDLVLIYLGDNDFSTELQPSLRTFAKRYAELLRKIRTNYGENVPILCVAAKLDPGIFYYISESVEMSGMSNVHCATMQEAVFNQDSDLGASYHPNYKGQKKMASIMIPYISTLTGWEMEAREYR